MAPGLPKEQETEQEEEVALPSSAAEEGSVGQGSLSLH